MTWLKGNPKTPGSARAASVFLFCAAALALLVFPEGAAGGGFPGFAPAQVPAAEETVNYDDSEPLSAAGRDFGRFRRRKCLLRDGPQ